MDTTRVIVAGTLIAGGALSAQAELFELRAELSPANQNGSNPDFFDDPNGVVPSDATGVMTATLDTDLNALVDFRLEVSGVLSSELMNFGPNMTPIHIHRPAAGQGSFGPVSVDATLGAMPGDFTDTADGFIYTRDTISILLADQGNVPLGQHPGDDQIVNLLTSGEAFILVHTTNPGILGFPFGELRGEVSVVPAPASALALVGMTGFAARRRRA